MKKNKYILFVLIIQSSLHAITQEQFMALAQDKTWDLYVGHNAHYQRIFRNKDAAIIELENKANWWKNIAISTSCFAVGSLLITVGIIGRKVFKE